MVSEGVCSIRLNEPYTRTWARVRSSPLFRAFTTDWGESECEIEVPTYGVDWLTTPSPACESSYVKRRFTCIGLEPTAYHRSCQQWEFAPPGERAAPDMAASGTRRTGVPCNAGRPSSERFSGHNR